MICSVICSRTQTTRLYNIMKGKKTYQVNGYLSNVLNNLAVKVPTCDSVVTTNFRHVKVLFNDDVEITSKKIRDNSQKTNKKLLYTREQVTVLKKAFRKDFGVGCCLPFPLTYLTKNVESNHARESRVVHENTYLNSFMTVTHQGDLSPIQVLSEIPRVGGPKGVCITYQGLKKYW
jgi:hypothetical protein